MNLLSRRYLVIAVLAGLLLGTAAFWWYLVKPLTLFTEHGERFYDLFEAPELAELAAAGRGQHPVLVHFWLPDCPCQLFADRHLDALRAQFPGLVLVVLVPEADAKTLAAARARFGDGVVVHSAPAGLAARGLSSPAGLVLDGSGKARYFGPYANGVLCTPDPENGFVEKILKSTGARGAGQILNLDAFGCYCRWPRSAPDR